MVRVVHPDFNDNSALAHKTMGALNRMKTLADERVADGTWGRKLPLPEYELIKVGRYDVQRRPLVGDVCDVFFGADAVVKAARSADDNDLMRAERSALKLLRTKILSNVKRGIPELLDGFQVGKREVNVLQAVGDGFVTAEAVHERLPAVEPRTLVWMFKRLLVLLEWAHHYGLVHGAVLPAHVMFYPDNDGATGMDERKHSVRLVDWCYSVEYAKRTRLSSWVPSWKEHYPPELLLKQSVQPASDIYMAAALVAYLAGGRSAVLNMPGPLKSVLLRCTEPDLSRRYQKVNDVFTEWVTAARTVYGEPKWFEFNLPK
jgi:hypothetical protein